MYLSLKPAAISSVDLGFLLKVAKETFVEGVCSILMPKAHVIVVNH